MRMLIVTEQLLVSHLFCESLEIVPVSTYLMEPRYAEAGAFHVINLCSSYTYQSFGYYVSLLAEARKHKVMPSVLAIQDFESDIFEAKISPEFTQQMQQTFNSATFREIELDVYFGKNADGSYKELCNKLYSLFQAPFFRVYIQYEQKKMAWIIQKIALLSFQDVPQKDYPFFQDITENYFDFTPNKSCIAKKKTTHFNLAILYNSQEVNANDRTAPSNQEALNRFIEAGKELGISAELIEKKDIKKLDECHGLFLRDTPSVNHYTYHFARYGELKKLVVIDDPISIIKCSNKVYLAELFRENHILTPETTIVSRHNYQEKIARTTFPCVLKLPDGSSSRGIKKAHSPEEMIKILKEFFKVSALILVQAFVPSDFDWRIVVLDGKPLLACRYFMAKGHWQLFNWDTEKDDCRIGNVESVALDDVPPEVIAHALEATNLIGNGLYGVDLKHINRAIYVIEINESPCLEYGNEDVLLGDVLYRKIMEVFLKRMQTNNLSTF